MTYLSLDDGACANVVSPEVKDTLDEQLHLARGIPRDIGTYTEADLK